MLIADLLRHLPLHLLRQPIPLLYQPIAPVLPPKGLHPHHSNLSPPTYQLMADLRHHLLPLRPEKGHHMTRTSSDQMACPLVKHRTRLKRKTRRRRREKTRNVQNVTPKTRRETPMKEITVNPRPGSSSSQYPQENQRLFLTPQTLRCRNNLRTNSNRL